MLEESLLAVVGSHPIFWKNKVFDRLAERPLLPDRMAAYLLEMGAFCAAARSPGWVVRTLSEGGFEEQGRVVEEIFASETGHGEAFADMARMLLRGSSQADGEWSRFDESRLQEGTRRAIEVLRYRENDDLSDALYSVGGLLTLEIAANRRIIPGQVAARLGEM